MEQASAIADVMDIRRMRGEGLYYRVRIGDYRLGIAVEGNVVTLIRFLHRRDIYRHFPGVARTIAANILGLPPG